MDSYAQELRTLFYCAYPQAQQGTEETEQMACTMLANQFAVGLRQEIKIKVAGVEGNFEQLLAKAKFEEAKLRDKGNPTTSLVPTRKQPNLPRSDRTISMPTTIKRGAIIVMQLVIFPGIVQYGDVPYL